MSALLPAELPRLLYVGFSVYALALVLLRWQATRVMTIERRFLLLFFLLELASTTVSGVAAICAGAPPDAAAWLTLLTQAFLAAYLFYAIPAEFRRWYHRFSRR